MQGSTSQCNHSLFNKGKKNTPKVRLKLYEERSLPKEYTGYRNGDCSQIQLFNSLILKLSINYQSGILHKTFTENLLKY